MNEIQVIGIIGAGTMGNGIAHAAARAGLRVLLCDSIPQALERAVATIAHNMDREIAREKLSADEKTSSLARITAAMGLKELAQADFIIEAIVENIESKLRIFEEIDTVSRPDVILASNTSSISISKIAGATRRPGQVVGMHFMNPVPMMPLVEVIRGLTTSEETVSTTEKLAERFGKTPVVVNDFPGFVSNRVLMPMINEAVFCVMEGVSSAESVDSIMKLGMNHPLGPLALADLIGLDVCLNTMEVLHNGLGDSKYRPCPLLRKMVDAGLLGRKSGQGFYRYGSS